MTDRIEALRHLGLDEKEAKIYLAALEYGPATMITLARKSGLKRTSIYNFIDDMVARGLIISSMVGKRTKYSAVSPGRLEEIAEKSREKIKEVLPGLMFMFDRSVQKPKVRLYDGIGGLKAVFNDTLDQPEGSEILGGTSFGEAYKILGQDFYDSYIRKRVARKISGRGFLVSDKYAQNRFQDNKAELREAILVSKEELPISVEFNIYQNKLALMSFGDENVGIIIESKQIVDLQRALFNLLWNALKQSQNNADKNTRGSTRKNKK